jgi:OFA family oxalate/formate antiporter-like MFS transporter
MLRTWQFYVAWVIYFLGSAVGLTAIGEAAPLINEVSGSTAIMTGAMALGVMSLFNGLGRLGWGTLSDRIGRNRALLGMAVISLATCAAILPHTSEFWRVLLGLCLVGFCYGGHLAVMPSLAADYYGPKSVGANYGILFSAWGAAGFVVPGYLSAIIERARQGGALESGYNEVFYILAGIAAAGGTLTFFARRP